MLEPVSFAMVATQLRLGSDTSEQDLIEGYIVAAREWVEDYTGQIVVQRNITDYFDGFEGRLRLRRRPVVEVDSIRFKNAAGEVLTFSEFDARLTGIIPYVHPSTTGWPLDVRPGSIAIEYLAGYAQIDVPQRFIQAILLLTAEFYRSRSAGALSPDAEKAVRSLLRSFRLKTL